VSDLNKSPFVAGLGLVWRRQSVLWWIFAVNFVLAGMGAATFMAQVSPVLDHSLQSQALAHGFNPIVFSALLMEAHGAAVSGMASACLVLVFFIFMLFVEGGLLQVYRLDRKLTKGEFFEASGRFFWRFVRLLIMLLIVLIPVGIVYGLRARAADLVDERSPSPTPGILVGLIGLLVVLFLMQAVRLWFDMAQVRAVAEDERAMRRALCRAFKITFGNFASLYWIYLRISIVAWLVMAALLWIWVRLVRPEWIGVSFLLTQLVLLSWLATRLWQRASETIWYQRRLPALVTKLEPAPAPPPPPAMEPEPSDSNPPVAGTPDVGGAA
jgi:xanthosine utilization system XapX-like protein